MEKSKRLPCWVARDPVKTVDGSFMRLKPYSCPHTWECINRFAETLFLEETTRPSELGLVTDPNPLGVDQILEWLGRRCGHPEKQKILTHTASLPPLGVLIPWHILRLIEKRARDI